jgi:hypothetical protein
MDFVLSTSCSNTFSKQSFTLGSVVGAGIAVTMALLCLIFQYFHHMVSFLCCMTERKFAMPLNPLLSAHAI